MGRVLLKYRLLLHVEQQLDSSNRIFAIFNWCETNIGVRDDVWGANWHTMKSLMWWFDREEDYLLFVLTWK